MKLNKNSRIWNLGDTSFRRKKLLDDYIELLKTLKKFNEVYDTWDSNSQKEFHIMVLKNTGLLEETQIVKCND